MPRDKFHPDTKEPHIHEHKGGITFTDVGHSHRMLVCGSQIRYGTLNEVVTDLRSRNDDRATQIADWIRNNIG